MNSFEFAAPVAMLMVAGAARYIIASVAQNRRHRRAEADISRVREEVIASLRLQLPKSAEFVVLEHKLRFLDERNRALVEKELRENSFETTTAETYEGRTAYWLAGKRACLVDRAPEEIALVLSLTDKCGGDYVSWDPQF
jgi:hypothetical protein